MRTKKAGGRPRRHRVSLGPAVPIAETVGVQPPSGRDWKGERGKRGHGRRCQQNPDMGAHLLDLLRSHCHWTWEWLPQVPQSEPIPQTPFLISVLSTAWLGDSTGLTRLARVRRALQTEADSRGDCAAENTDRSGFAMGPGTARYLF